MLVDAVIGNIHISWLHEQYFYVVTGMVFYALLRRLTRSPEVSFVATLLLVTNYAAVTGGLAYLMDMSGWMLYIISLYCALRYMQTGSEKWLYFSAAAIGVGGVFKEYAFAGVHRLGGKHSFYALGAVDAARTETVRERAHRRLPLSR